jgi:hypothetical protein
MAFLAPLVAVVGAGAGAAGAAGVGGAAAAGTLAEIGTAAAVAGSAISAVGAIQSANAQSASAKYNAQIATQNQQQANQNASLAAASGDQQAAIQQQKTRAEVGAIKAQQAASNVDVNTGSAVDVQSSAAQLGELNAITIRSNAARTAYGYETQATGFGNEATLQNQQSSYDQTAGEIGAAGTFLGGVGNASDNYARYLAQGGLGASGAGAGLGNYSTQTSSGPY